MATLLAPHVGAHPDAPAVLADDVELTWAGLASRVDRWVHALRAHGLGPGDRVACVSGNSAGTFEVLLAALHSGITLVPVNWHLTAPEITHILVDSGSAGVVVDAERSEVVAHALAAAGGARALRVVLGAEARPGFETAEGLLAAVPPSPPADQTCGATMMYTSGTTGAPKGVLNGLFVAGAPFGRVDRLVRYATTALLVPTAGRVLLAGPWYHSAQLFFALLPLLAGATLVVHRRFDPRRFLADVAARGVTAAHLVPTHFHRLLQLDERDRRRHDLSGLRLVWHGGGPCPPAVKRAMIEWWGPVLVEYYGATEGGAATLITSEEWLARPGSVGRALPPNDVLVVDDAGSPLPPGRTGRVFVRRRSGRTFEYHNAPEKTRAAHLSGDAFTFGELGRLDEDGYLYLTGRAHDLIVTGGVNVYPAEVESVLTSHPAVRDAAVVGVPDEEYGERVTAVVELATDRASDPATGPPGSGARDDGRLAAELTAHCRRRLAGFKVPREYVVVASLPRDATGKLRTDDLRSLAARWPVPSHSYPASAP
jgi:acyl-CoA synthetase (AMP-forming)/AMP-acid ligase II